MRANAAVPVALVMFGVSIALRTVGPVLIGDKAVERRHTVLVQQFFFIQLALVSAVYIAIAYGFAQELQSQQLQKQSQQLADIKALLELHSQQLADIKALLVHILAKLPPLN